MTKSERLFESVLSNRCISYEKIPEQPKEEIRTPDYKVKLNKIETYWEVKELKENPDEKKIQNKIKTDSHEIFEINSIRVTKSIKSASDQFKKYGVTNHPCVIVLYDNRDFSVKDFIFYQYVETAMLGKADYMKNTSGKYIEINRRNGLLTNHKKYISAVAILVEKTKDLHFYHNPNTTNPLSHEIDLPQFSNHCYAIKEENGLKWKKI